MLKKAKAESASGRSESASGLSKSVLESSHQIWLAGLGAFAKAQEGGAKVFETLVKQGEALESRTRKAAAFTAEAARDAAKTKAKEMQAMAGGTWDKLEQVFEDRVSRALAKIGVHSSADVERLSQRVNDLSEAVNALLKAQGASRGRVKVAGKKVTAAAGKGKAGNAARAPTRQRAKAAGTAAGSSGKKKARAASKAAKTAKPE